MSQKYIFLLLFLILLSFSVYARNALDGVAIDRYSSERNNIGFLDQNNVWTGDNNFTGNATFNNFVIINFTSINASGEINATGFCLNGVCVTVWDQINNSIWTRTDAKTYLTSLADFVGIGTDEPTHELHVVGDVNITGTAYIHELDGNSPIIVKTDMILDPGNDVTADNFIGSGQFLTDINLSSVDGTATFNSDVNIIGNLSLEGDLDMNNNSVLNVHQIYVNDTIFAHGYAGLSPIRFVNSTGGLLMTLNLSDSDSGVFGHIRAHSIKVDLIEIYEGITINATDSFLSGTNVAFTNESNIFNPNQIFNISIETGLIYLDDSHIYSIYWNETEKKLYLPGNTTFINISDVNLTVITSITLNGTTIYDWNDIIPENATYAANATYADIALSTICSGEEVLLGNGSCQVITSGTQLYEEDVIIVVSGGSGSGTTSTCCTNAEILQVSVLPTTSTNRYYFEANVTSTGAAVDTNRVGHQGDWIVAHRGSTVTSDTISYYITGATIDESVTVRVRYLQ